MTLLEKASAYVHVLSYSHKSKDALVQLLADTEAKIAAEVRIASNIAHRISEERRTLVASAVGGALEYAWSNSKDALRELQRTHDSLKRALARKN